MVMLFPIGGTCFEEKNFALSQTNSVEFFTRPVRRRDIFMKRSRYNCLIFSAREMNEVMFFETKVCSVRDIVRTRQQLEAQIEKRGN